MHFAYAKSVPAGTPKTALIVFKPVGAYIKTILLCYKVKFIVAIYPALRNKGVDPETSSG